MRDIQGTGQEPLRQFQFVAAHSVDGLLLQPTQRRMKAHDARKVHGSGFKTIRHKRRHLFLMADTAGTACNQRLHQRDHIRLKDKAADPLGPQKSFMPRKSQRVNMHGLHINGKNTGRLGRIQNETQAMRMTKRSHRFHRHQRSADITGVKHHHRTGILPQQSVHSGNI